MKQMVTDTQMNQVITYRNCKFIINEAYSSNGLYVRALETKSWIKAGDSQWLSKRALKKALQGVAIQVIERFDTTNPLCAADETYSCNIRRTKSKKLTKGELYVSKETYL